MYRKGTARAALACALAVLAAAALAGCGGLASGEDREAGAGEAKPARADRGASGAQSGGAARAVAERPAPAPAPGAGRGGHGRCRALTAPLLRELERLRRRLVPGLDYTGYLEAMRGLRRAYDALPVERLPFACLERVARPAEQALNRYIAALNIWSDCVAEPGCRAAAVEVPLQRRWRDAARRISRARDAAG